MLILVSHEKNPNKANNLSISIVFPRWRKFQIAGSISRYDLLRLENKLKHSMSLTIAVTTKT